VDREEGTDYPQDLVTTGKPQQPDHEWLPKKEAAELLGRAIGQLERRAKDGYIAKRAEEKKPWEKSARVYYSRADILALVRGEPNRYPRLMSERSTAGNGGNDGDGNRGSNDSQSNGGSQWDGADTARTAMPAKKPWLTLAEASQYSGLSQDFLRKQAEAGTIHSVNENVSGQGEPAWMFSRKGLKKVGKT